jgi:type IV fimbrial biogenesis protein FimT
MHPACRHKFTTPGFRTSRLTASWPGSNSGFTIIELMVTVVVLSVIVALGLPNLREFLVRNQVAAITAEFSSDISRARTEAIAQNNCVTICMSSNTANALTGGTPTCATTGSNWQAGWIIFSNPSCSSTQNNPTTAGSNLISVRQTGADTFELNPASGNALRRLTFDSRGLAAGVQKNFTLAYLPENTNSPHYRSICLSSAGRVTTREYAGVSACP